MRFSKRAFDLALAIPGVIVSAPFLAAVAAVIRLEDGGPSLFRQERLGIHGLPFRVWKFRTMRVDAGGEPITLGDDGRVTGIGRVLRRYRLDELPQVFNVLAGEMSLVGPRPEVAKYAAHYSDEQRRVLELVPGITDPGVLAVRDYRTSLRTTEEAEEYYLKQVMPEKVRLSCEYAERATLLSDIGVILRTLAAIMPRRP